MTLGKIPVAKIRNLIIVNSLCLGDGGDAAGGGCGVGDAGGGIEEI